MRVSFIILFLMCQIYFCNSQTIVGSKIDSKPDTSFSIIDPIEEIPFVIERESNSSTLFDKSGTRLIGIAALRLYVNEQGIIKKFQIVKLSLKKDSTSFIEYQRKEFYLV